jgi:hypothetical protein
MTALTLPLPTSKNPRYTYRTILDGSEFKLSFNYLSRGDSSWHLSIYDKQDNPIAYNLKMIPWFDMLSGLPKGKLPAGKLGLVCISESDPNAPSITLENLSTDFKLVYYTAL